jgi:hypothetical protein
MTRYARKSTFFKGSTIDTLLASMSKSLSAEPEIRFSDPSASGAKPAERLKRRRTGFSEKSVVDTRDGLQELILVKASESGVRAHEYMPINYEPLIQSYGGDMSSILTALSHCHSESSLVTVKSSLSTQDCRPIR